MLSAAVIPVPEMTEAARQANIFTVEVVCDEAYILHSAQRRGCRCPAHDRLVGKAVEELAKRLGGTVKSDCDAGTEGMVGDAGPGPRVVCRGVWLIVAEPVNVHPADRGLNRRRMKRLADIERRFGFVAVRVPVDWHGYHLRAEDRRRSASKTEQQWVPEDKGTDVTMAMHLVQRAEAQDHPDGLIAMTGDADLAPAIQRVQHLRPDILVAVAGFKHSFSRVYLQTSRVGYAWQSKPIFLDHYLAPRRATREMIRLRAGLLQGAEVPPNWRIRL